MSKCPECGAEITYLKAYPGCKVALKFTIDSKGQPDYYEIDRTSEKEWSKNWYECPKCTVVLFLNEEEAINFLKGGG